MAAIRSHLISLFSGGIFPDRKWWLSCFCLPHSKEERPVRQHPPAERAIYTIQTSHDEDPKTEFTLFSGLEGTSEHEEESHESGAMVSEAPLANGFKVHLLHSLSFNNRRKDATESLTEESEVKANDVDDVVDVMLLSISESIITEAEESSSCMSPEASLPFYETVNKENKESLTDIQLSAADNDRERVVPAVCTSTEGLAGEQSFASSLISCNPLFADLGESQSSPSRNIEPVDATREVRESEIVNEVLSENIDDAKDGLKFTTDVASICSSDHSFNLETSGIQSNLSSFEDTFVPLSTFSENGTRMLTSDEDSERCFQFDSFHAKSCSAESTSHDLLHTPIDSCHTGEIPAMSNCDDRQEMRKSTFPVSQSLGMVLSENVEKPFNEGNCLELCNGLTEQEAAVEDNHSCGAVTQVILLGNNFDEQSFPFEVRKAESDALFKRKCDAAEDCGVSDQLLQHEVQNIIDTSYLTIEQSYNQVAKAELETTFTGIAVDMGNSAEIVNISAQSTGNAESTVSQLRPDALTPDNEEAAMADESSECLDGNNFAAWSYCGVKDQEMDAFDESMRLHSLLQMKLLFRPDSYETLERLVDGETVFLLGKALDEVFTVRRNSEILHSRGRKGSGNFRCEVDEIRPENGMNGMLHCDELSSVGHQDPFNLSKSNVFQEIVIENFEQLFDNEEWLDDDFGFSSAIKSEFQQPPYCDRIIGQQDYSREAFCLRDFELEDDFQPPDLQLPVIQLMPETIFPLVDQATDIFWSRRRYGEPVSAVCPPETYFTVEGHSGDVDSCSQRSHETFVFHLVKEILQEVYCDELTEVPEPWHRVYNFKPKCTENPPTTVDVLKPLLHSRVLQWLKFDNGFPHEMTEKSSGLRKQLDKKDMVDRLLITEMYHEEPSWTDYTQDANMIKNRVANKLFISLIDDTVQAFKFIQSNALTNKCQ